MKYRLVLWLRERLEDPRVFVGFLLVDTAILVGAIAFLAFNRCDLAGITEQLPA
jgi:hypothetical protein